jgi:hypothetical protein
MQVKLTTNLGTNLYPWVAEEIEKYTEGKVVDVTDQQGAVLLKRGHAVAVDTKAHPAHAEPAKNVEKEPPAKNVEAGIKSK